MFEGFLAPLFSPRAFTLGIHGVGEGWVGAAPNGGAAGGVGNDQTLPEELSHQLHVGGLSTTLAGTTCAKDMIFSENDGRPSKSMG